MYMVPQSAPAASAAATPRAACPAGACAADATASRVAPAHITAAPPSTATTRSEEHTSELQSPCNLVCRLLLEKKKKNEHTQRSLTHEVQFIDISLLDHTKTISHPADS